MVYILRGFVWGTGLAALIAAVLLRDSWIMWAVFALSLVMVIVLTGTITAAQELQRRQQIKDAIRAGRIGVARIDSVKRIGGADESPLVEFGLTVAIDGRVFRTSTKQVLDLIDAARLTRGSRHAAVWLDQGPATLKLLNDLETVEVEQYHPGFDPDAVELPPPGRAPEWSPGTQPHPVGTGTGFATGAGGMVNTTSYGSTTGAAGAVFGQSPASGTSTPARRRRVPGIVTLAAFVAGLLLVASPNAPLYTGLAELSWNMIRGEANDMLQTEPEAIVQGITELRESAPSETLNSVYIFGTRMTAEIMLAGSDVDFDKYSYGVPGIPFDSGVHHEGEGLGTADEPFTFDDVPWERIAEFREIAIQHAISAGFTGISAEQVPEVVMHIRRGMVDDLLNVSFYFQTRDNQNVSLDMNGQVIDQYPHAADLADPADAVSLTSKPDQLLSAWDEILEIAPSTVAQSIGIYETHLIAELEIPGGEWDKYQWRTPQVAGNSGASHEGPTNNVSAYNSFDAATIPWEIIPGLVDASLASAGVTRADLEHDPYVTVSRWLDNPEPTINVNLSTERDHYSYEYTLAGELIPEP